MVLVVYMYVGKLIKSSSYMQFLRVLLLYSIYKCLL